MNTFYSAKHYILIKTIRASMRENLSSLRAGGGGGGGGGVVNNTGADQPAHPRSLISAFVIHILESTISKLATSEISFF